MQARGWDTDQSYRIITTSGNWLDHIFLLLPLGSARKASPGLEMAEDINQNSSTLTRGCSVEDLPLLCPPVCHQDPSLLCRVSALGFVGFGRAQWGEGRGECSLGWSSAAPPLWCLIWSVHLAGFFLHLLLSPFPNHFRGRELHHGGRYRLGVGKLTQWGQNADRYLRLPERRGGGVEKGIHKALSR